ncbi:MAG: 5-(carboxyamino)imidazole ribonucleotide synthase [Geitlerinemataceae cyanobacterium]
MISSISSNIPQAVTPDRAVGTIGAVGGGQLAWMMAIAAKKLGILLLVQAPRQSDPAVSEAADWFAADIDDASTTAKLADRCGAIAFENEFVDLDALQPLADRGVTFVPPIHSLRPLLDKYKQRCFMREIGLPTPQFCELSDPANFDIAALGGSYPVVVKARRHGYDGQGTAIARSAADVAEIWERWGRPSVEVEEFVPFESELAVIVSRDRSGSVAVFPIVETQQVDRVCRRAIAPAVISQSAIQQCTAIAHTLVEQLDAVGVFAIELFLTKDDRVLVNEIAPRTHNSGHLTIEACNCSQFEQVVRIAAGLPLGDVSLQHDCALMVNLLGLDGSSDEDRRRAEIAAMPDATVHWYGKASRPGRKLGHVTVTLDSIGEETTAARRDRALSVARQIEAIWYGTKARN